MAVDPRRMNDLFAAASELPTADRKSFLDRECGGDTELRQRVDSLSRAHDTAGHSPADPQDTGAFRTEPGDARPGGGTSEFQALAEPGVVLSGRYTLVESIGEGGMGEVWVARQSEPVKRRVAVKLIKAGMDTRAVLQRFEIERQALALMDHPNIARVFDGGMTADRRPFFVMELVDGLPLTKFCDEARLGIRPRLELFATICQAA
ncbi:MAG TPA: protein kinase, partial [Gemmataceae bacterium]|nr:protein kinase [Gemmataceae bacterium]